MQLTRRKLIAVSGTYGVSACLDDVSERRDGDDSGGGGNTGDDGTDAGEDTDTEDDTEDDTGDDTGDDAGSEVVRSWRSFQYDAANVGHSEVEAPRELVSHSAVHAEGPVNSSPAAADGRIYFTSTDGNLYCVEEEGELWSYDTGSRSVSSPAVYDDTIYVGNDAGELHAVDVASGERIWRYRGEGAVTGAPTVDPDGSSIYFGSTADRVYALNPDGEEVWRLQTNEEVETTPAVIGDVVTVTTRGAVIYRVDADTGDQVNSHSVGDGVRSSPAVVSRDGRDINVFGSEDGRVYAVEFWRDEGVRRVDRRWTRSTGGAVRSSPSVAGERVYVGSDDGSVYAVSLEDGSVIWRHETDDRVRSSPSVSEDAVYVGSDDGYVYAFDAEDGELLWRHETDHVVRSSPAVADAVHVGSADGGLHSFFGAGDRE